MVHVKSHRLGLPLTARTTRIAAFELLEDRRLMSTYSYSVTVGSYAAGITSGHDSGTGSLPATAVSIDSPAPPALEDILRAALTQASVTLAATHTATTSGSYSGSGPSSSDRVLFLPAEETGKNYPGTRSRESSLADAFGLSGDYVLAFEDGTDFDYNDGYFLVTITSTPGPAGVFATVPISSAITATPGSQPLASAGLQQVLGSSDRSSLADL